MSNIIEIKVPDIGDVDEVDVIEVLVAENDQIDAEQSLITVESDKASMEIPAPQAGTVQSVSVKVGDKVSEGTVILMLATDDAGDAKEEDASSGSDSSQQPSSDQAKVSDDDAAATPQQSEEAMTATAERDSSGDDTRKQQDTSTTRVVQSGAKHEMASTPRERQSPTSAYGAADVPLRNLPHASPSVRKFARELGVDLYRVEGTGARHRITHDDVRQFVKQALAQDAPAARTTVGQGGLDILGWPNVDFTRFGEIESRPLSRIQKLSGANLHRNWVMIPHVTNNDVADITDLEKLRNQLNKENEKEGVRVTMLAFIIKAVVAALQKFPEFNASLDGETLILKKYFHIGFAADTPNGLVVPVIRDADTKGVLELAQETRDLAASARSGKLSAAQMQGGCFSISSLGGIGGTTFTPIINAPEVAILGVSRSSMEPVWNGSKFKPRLMLPLSLSYDHRVIDGAAAARFNAYLTTLLADFRRIAL